MPKKIPSIKVDWPAVRAALAPYLKRAPEFAARFLQISKRHARLKAAVLSQVKTWECYTFSNWNLDPSYFLLSGYLRPGRRMKTDPGPDAKVLRYGLDAAGRIVLERWPSNSQESFWEYETDRIDQTAVSTSSRPGSKYFCINVQSLFLENGRPVWFFAQAREAVSLRLFKHENGRIVQVLCAYASTRPGARPTKGWVYEFNDITYDAKGDARVRRFHQAGYAYAHIYKIPKRAGAKSKVPVLDLRIDVTDTVAALEKAVKQFAAKQAGGKKSVSGIGLGFHPFENPQIFIRFDTRPKFEPDGEWTHPEWHGLKRARWSRFIESCEDNDGKGALIDAKGRRHEITEVEQDERIVGWLGEALVAALKKARETGVFKKLRTTAHCELNVEDAADGAFGWPKYEDRGKQNLVK